MEEDLGAAAALGAEDPAAAAAVVLPEREGAVEGRESGERGERGREGGTARQSAAARQRENACKAATAVASC